MKSVVRLLLIIIVLLFLPLLIHENLVARENVDRARAEYERTATRLKTTTADLQRIERRLTRLTTSLGAVEDEVREQHRMIRPGETLVLINSQ
jgi:cell division protein FtsB